MIEVLKQMVDALQTYSDKHRKTYLLEGAWDEEITKGDAAIEAGKKAIKELESQEPVMWITPSGEGFRIRFTPPTSEVPLGWDALYTHPSQRTEQEPMIAFNAEVIGYVAQQRTWVGLTDEEFEYCVALKNPLAVAEEVEAKLKEKNT
jgi:hypothetical protein